MLVRVLVKSGRYTARTQTATRHPGGPGSCPPAQATQALVSGRVSDALAVLAAVAELALGAEQAEAVALLALVAGQDVEAGQRPGSSASAPGRQGRAGMAPVATTSWSKASQRSLPASRSRTWTARRSRSMAVASWRRWTSMAKVDRKVSGLRAMSRVASGTTPPTR